MVSIHDWLPEEQWPEWTNSWGSAGVIKGGPGSGSQPGHKFRGNQWTGGIAEGTNPQEVSGGIPRYEENLLAKPLRFEEAQARYGATLGEVKQYVLDNYGVVLSTGNLVTSGSGTSHGATTAREFGVVYGTVQGLEISLAAAGPESRKLILEGLRIPVSQDAIGDVGQSLDRNDIELIKKLHLNVGYMGRNGWAGSYSPYSTQININATYSGTGSSDWVLDKLRNWTTNRQRVIDQLKDPNSWGYERRARLPVGYSVDDELYAPPALATSAYAGMVGLTEEEGAWADPDKSIIAAMATMVHEMGHRFHYLTASKKVLEKRAAKHYTLTGNDIFNPTYAAHHRSTVKNAALDFTAFHSAWHSWQPTFPSWTRYGRWGDKQYSQDSRLEDWAENFAGYVLLGADNMDWFAIPRWEKPATNMATNFLDPEKKLENVFSIHGLKRS